MNEEDKGRGDRKRSSRRRGRGSGRARDPKDTKDTAAREAEERSKQAAGRPRGPEKQGRRKGSEPSRSPEPEAVRGEAARRPGEKQPQAPRPRFSAPRLESPVLPKPTCPRCGKPIEDLPSALNDKTTGEPLHFDCVLERIAEAEGVAEGDKVVYIGGGRFGIVHFDNPQDLRRFQIKKTIQWEEKEKRAEWRRDVADQYSAT